MESERREKIRSAIERLKASIVTAELVCEMSDEEQIHRTLVESFDLGFMGVAFIRDAIAVVRVCHSKGR